MKSVLGKFIQREFGKERYCCYADKLRKKESMDIFCDIYEKLQHKDSEMLNEALRKLLETIQTSIRISKNFLYINGGIVFWEWVHYCSIFICNAFRINQDV